MINYFQKKTYEDSFLRSQFILEFFDFVQFKKSKMPYDKKEFPGKKSDIFSI